LIFSQDFLNASAFDLNKYCYLFEPWFEPSPELSRIYRELEKAYEEWVEVDRTREANLLYSLSAEGLMVVKDTRRSEPVVYTLSGAQTKLLLTAETPRSYEFLKTQFAQDGSDGLDEVLGELKALGLIFWNAGELVSLALPENDVAPRRRWRDNYRTRWQRLPQAADEEPRLHDPDNTEERRLPVHAG
jgi:hypothetical protein